MLSGNHELASSRFIRHGACCEHTTVRVATASGELSPPSVTLSLLPLPATMNQVSN